MRRLPVAFACVALAILAILGSVRITSLALASPLSTTGSANAVMRDLLARDFASTDLSYLALDLRTNSPIPARWTGSDEAIPVGSLVKPFLAVAYAESHGFQFPEHNCLAGTCWLPRGHGQLGIVRAVAMSCNSYFTSLAEGVTAEQVTEVARRYGLGGPPRTASPAALAGRYGEWRESPAAMARAYAELLSRRTQPGIAEIVAGMRESARGGTGAGVSRGVPQLSVLAKTGTAPCTHTPRAPGDGFVIAAWPADSPRYLLLLRQHGHPGALAAVTAGRILQELVPQQ